MRQNKWYRNIIVTNSPYDLSVNSVALSITRDAPFCMITWRSPFVTSLLSHTRGTRPLNLVRVRSYRVVIRGFASQHPQEGADCEDRSPVPMKYTLIQRLPQRFPVICYRRLRAQRYIRMGTYCLLMPQTAVLLLQRLLVRQAHRGLYRRVLRLP